MDVEAKLGPVYWIMDKIAHDPKAQRAGEQDRVKNIPAEWLSTPGVDAFGFYSAFSNFRACRYEELIGKFRYMTGLAHDAARQAIGALASRGARVDWNTR